MVRLSELISPSGVTIVDAIVDPTPTDDSYAKGTPWYNNATPSSPRVFECTTKAPGASVWAFLNAAAGGTPHTEYHLVTSGEELAKQFTLTQTPLYPSKVLVDIMDGTEQEYSVDFTISGNVFQWSGLGLDGTLLAGQKVRLFYHY